MVPESRRPPRVALLAAREDVAWLKKLQTHLRPIAWKGGFEVWDSSNVLAGARWRDAVAEGFAAASVVLVLVSSSLLADDEFTASRLPELIARADAASVRLLVLIVGACVVEATDLAAFRPLNGLERPLEGLPPAEQDRLLLAAAMQLAAAAAAAAGG